MQGVQAEGRAAPWLAASGNHLGVAMLSWLAWIAQADGNLAVPERRALEALARSVGVAGSLETALHLFSSPGVEDLQLMSEVLLHLLDERGRRLFVQMAIGMALEDGVLAPTEALILPALARVLRVRREDFEALFREATGRPYPSPPDPSAETWWPPRKEGSTPRRRRQEGMSRVRAMAILGLREGFSSVDLRDAYRRLARANHPDRFVTLGEAAVEAATVTFRRIKQAHDLLAGA